MNFVIEPITDEIAESVRLKMLSPQYGHPAYSEIASGYGPCRYCLQTFREGEEDRILFTYNAFEGLLDTPLPGPVFIHRDVCTRYRGKGFPYCLARLPLLFECYAPDGVIVRTETVDQSRADDRIAKLLDLPRVSFINVRNAEAGCHVTRIVPA